MKLFFSKILIYLLRKLNVSVAINIQVDGSIKVLNKQSFLYDCDLKNAKLINAQDFKLSIPDNKPFDTQSSKFEEIEVFTYFLHGGWVCWETLNGREYYGATIEEVQESMEEYLNKELKPYQIAFWHEPKKEENEK